MRSPMILLDRCSKTLRTSALIRNSFYYIMASGFNALFGFLFWIVAARFYAVSEIGIGAAIISAMGLLIVVSRLGMDFSMIRFFPTGEKERIIGTSIALTGIFALLLGGMFILVIDIVSPDLLLLRNPLNSSLFILGIEAYSIVTILGSALMAGKMGGLYFVQNIASGLRVPFLFTFVFLGAMGVFVSTAVAYLLMAILGLALISQSHIRVRIAFDWRYIRRTLRYSSANYFSSMLITAPALIMSLVVLAVAGTEDAAFYSVSYVIASILFMIPVGVSTSLFVEGSHGESMSRMFRKSTTVTLYLLLVASVVLVVFSDVILHFIGTTYVQGSSELLRTMIVASLPVGFFYLFSSRLRVEGDLRFLLYFSAWIFISLVALSYILLSWLGLVGIGIAWILSYSTADMLFLARIKMRNHS